MLDDIGRETETETKRQREIYLYVHVFSHYLREILVYWYAFGII